MMAHAGKARPLDIEGQHPLQLGADVVGRGPVGVGEYLGAYLPAGLVNAHPHGAPGTFEREGEVQHVAGRPGVELVHERGAGGQRHAGRQRVVAGEAQVDGWKGGHGFL